MFREMRRIRQLMSKEDCIDILVKAPRGTLAVLGDEGYPYCFPVNFVYNEGYIYFHCAAEGHKIDAIRKCDKASFCVLDEGQQMEGDWHWLFHSIVVLEGSVCWKTVQKYLKKPHYLGKSILKRPAIRRKKSVESVIL